MQYNYSKDQKMQKKFIVFLLIPALLTQLYGCYSTQDISKNEVAGLKDGGDLIVYTKDSTIYSFEASNYYISNDTLYGKGYVKFNEESDFKVPIEKSISLTNIDSAQQDEMNASGTTWLLVGGILLVDIVVLGLQVAAALSGI
jgi:hypothetical protein